MSVLPFVRKAQNRAVERVEQLSATGVAGDLENALTARLWAEKQGLNWWWWENHYRMLEVGYGNCTGGGHNGGVLVA